MAIELLSNPYKWVGIPFKDRYAWGTRPPSDLLAAMHRIDDLLDLAFYMPTEKWHVIRWYDGKGHGRPFVRVWECREDPQRGLHDYLGSWVIDALKRGDTRGRDVLKEMDENNAAIEAANNRSLEDAAKDTAKDLAKVFSNWHDFGPNSETHLNYSVGSHKTSNYDNTFKITDKRRVK